MKKRRINCDAANRQAVELVREGRCSEVSQVFVELPMCRKSTSLREDYRYICGRPLSGKKRRRRSKRR